MQEKVSAEYVSQAWPRLREYSLGHGQVQCHVCRQIYPLGDKHGCKAAPPPTVSKK